MAIKHFLQFNMHCLPAHRGEKVSAEVIDGAHSMVLDLSENRLHVQKALMEYLFLGKVEVQVSSKQ